MQIELLKQIPKIDELLGHPGLAAVLAENSRRLVTEAARQVIEELRAGILSGACALIEEDALVRQIIDQVEAKKRRSLRRIINATGVILHTNLGRAVLSEEAAEAVKQVASGYSTLEYNCELGQRGSRYDHVERLITRVTGAESAMVVNNNAAAVLLVLDTMAKNRQVVVSRGELVEIGGSFRVPEIMEHSNTHLIEVGTTNKTHVSDYVCAIQPGETAALLKVHTSNYKIIGFTEEVALEELVEIGHAEGIPVIYDLGSGSLLSLERYGIAGEPNVPDAVKSGADIISFSGDKLLGGPQAGIIVGKREYIERMKKNPLTRALRIDKLTLAGLEATLFSYLDPEKAAENIPTYRMLATPVQELRRKAENLREHLEHLPGISLSVVEDYGQMGGGSVPGQMLPTVVLALQPQNLSVNTIEERLRRYEVPIICRIAKDQLRFDLRTIEEDDFAQIAAALESCMC